MEKKGTKTEWKAEDSSPMPTKGRKNANFQNQTTHSTSNRFPLIAIIIVVLLLLAIGFVLFFVNGMT